MSKHHQHQHVMLAVGSGSNVDEAVFNAVAGLTDPQGHTSGLVFDSFKVVEIEGTIQHNPGDHGTPGSIRVTLQASGTHSK